MNKRQKFIERATLRHNSKFDYSLVHDFKIQKEVVEIICPVHGVFTQTVSNHLHSGGCKKCGIECASKVKRKSQDKFIQEAKNIYGNRFLYDKVEYKNRHTPVVITCRIHGDFTMTPGNHIGHKKCCNKCSSIRAVRVLVRNILEKRFKGLVQPEEYKLIPLSNNTFCKVSNEDFDVLSKHVWSNSGNLYPFNTSLGLMHRYIIKPDHGMLVDHINRDPLDNRRCNLRVCNAAENSYNSIPKPNSSSVFKGVTCKPRGTYISRIRFNGKSIHIGSFKNEIEAAKAYDTKAKELFGEFAFLNFPELK